MRTLFSIFFLVLAAVLGFFLYKSIEEPIAFTNYRANRKDVVVEKLQTIRRTQEMYRDITDTFATSFDQLTQVLSTEDFKIIKVTGDPDDPNFAGTVTYDTIRRPAADSIKVLGIDLANLRYVPFTDNKVSFEIQAKTIPNENYSSKSPVVLVGTPWKSFMGAYGDARFAQYDRKYDPNQLLSFGNLEKQNLAGNWE
ncbi:MAG: hypothetical protein HC821_00790 [Lewinella sp.]|nr:hypothetical protein [Lewinella sp.]